MASLEINSAGFQIACEQAGLDTYKALAHRIGVDLGTVSRVMSGRSKPGARFVAGAVVAFGATRFPDLFSATSR